MVPTAPIDNIFVQFDKKYQDEIITESGIKFFKDTTFAPEWNPTVTGKVVSVPNRLSSDPFKSCIHPEVQVGDELFFSYLVVHDKEVKKDPEYFFEVSHVKSRNKEFQNCLKDKVVVQYKNKEGVGVYTDASGDILDGIHDKAPVVEKWLSRFKFAGEGQEVYANIFPYNGEDYWKVDYVWAIAAKRGEEIIMIAGNCLLEPPEDRMVYEMDHERQLHLINKVDNSRAKLLNIGKPLKGRPELDVKPGDYVRFNEAYVQKYELWGKQYWVLNQERLICK